MRLKLLAGVAAVLVLSGCGTRGSYTEARVAPLAPQPVQPVAAQTLPPPEMTPTMPETETAMIPPATQDPSTALEIRRPDLSGGWTISAGGETCQLFMSLTTWTGGYRANTRGCSSSELQSVGAWDLSGREVVLKNAEGEPLARLYASAATRFSGQSTTGRGVQVYR
jgi:hypothetical protein